MPIPFPSNCKLHNCCMLNIHPEIEGDEDGAEVKPETGKHSPCWMGECHEVRDKKNGEQTMAFAMHEKMLGSHSRMDEMGKAHARKH